MSKTINVGDKFVVILYDSRFKSINIQVGSVLMASEIRLKEKSVLWLVNTPNIPDFYMEFGTGFIQHYCLPFEEHRYKDNLEEPASNITPKCDCGVTKVYGENIGPEMHAHYCSIKSQQLNT